MLAFKEQTSQASLSSNGKIRCRTWAFPEVQSHSLVVLTLDTLFLTPLVGDPKLDVVKALESGADPETVIDPLAIRIDLATLRKVRLNLLANSIVMDFANPSHGTGRLEVLFSSQTAADACFTKLWRRLGNDFQLLPYKRDTWSLIRTPAMLLMAVICCTLVLAMIAHGYEEGAEARLGGMLLKQPPTFLETIFGLLSWQTICGIGGGLAALLQVWIYRLVTEPPVKLVIVAAGDPLTVRV